MRIRSLRQYLLITAALVAAASGLLHAEEGMWTFDNPPLKLLKARYDFVPTQAWLDHLRLSSVRLNDGGSGAFVSPDGLLLTNHHVARGQLQKNSTAAHNYLRDGFYAATRDQEIKSPDLEINVLVAMQNVTARVQGVAQGVADDIKALKARDEEITAIEAEAKARSGLRSEVVPLYSGGEYWLYQYKVYTDVRLVFAPEEQAAVFGGDADNYTYPRYNLDMALFRVYENGKPLHPANYLKWSSSGASPGELVFVSGHPGATERQLTMQELLFERDAIEPPYIDYFKHRVDAAEQFARGGAEQARLVDSTIVMGQNALKVLNGRYEALKDKQVMAKKQAEEDQFRRRIAANPEGQKEYGDAWDLIAAADRKAAPREAAEIFRRTDSRLFSIARQIVQYVCEVKKPDAERLDGYHDAQLESLRFQVLSPAPIELSTERLFMGTALRLAAERLGNEDQYLEALLNGVDVDTFIDTVLNGTRLRDVAFRKSLLDGGEAAVVSSGDPIIAAALRTDSIVREDRRWQHDELESVLTSAGEKLAKARFLVYGKDTYPDATSTLRLSFGTVQGYAYNGTVAPPFTTFYGIYDRAAGFREKPPFELTPKQATARSTLDMATPLNFASTNDITGGNSGSPVVNREGELVGLIFDGNIESLAGEYVYEGEKNRAVSVHAAGMIEALRKIYGAGALVEELLGKP